MVPVDASMQCCRLGKQVYKKLQSDARVMMVWQASMHDQNSRANPKP